MNRALRCLAALLFACATPVAVADEETDAYRAKFIGRWTYNAGNRETVVTRDEDGTWRSRTTERGKILVMLSGVWWAREGSLSGVCLQSSDPKIPTGVPDASKVVEVGDDSYTIENRHGEKKRYVRAD